MNLQHGLQVIGDLEWSRGLAVDFVHRNALGELGQGQALRGADLEHSQVGDDLPHAPGAGKRESAV